MPVPDKDEHYKVSTSTVNQYGVNAMAMYQSITVITEPILCTPVLDDHYQVNSVSAHDTHYGVSTSSS
jgi:hypothetical protein